jgi:hypothetical protein
MIQAGSHQMIPKMSGRIRNQAMLMKIKLIEKKVQFNSNSMQMDKTKLKEEMSLLRPLQNSPRQVAKILIHHSSHGYQICHHTWSIIIFKLTV